MGDGMLRELDGVLGPVAVLSLQRRGLLAPEGSGTVVLPARAVVADRVAGALLGAAAGNALGSVAQYERRRRGLDGFVSVAGLRRVALSGRAGAWQAETQELVLAVEAALTVGWAAAPWLSDALVAHAADLRTPGRAVVETVARRRHGLPWFEAGVDSFGNGALCRAAATGLVHAADARALPVLAALDAAVTHAHPRAVAASVVAATAIAELLTRDGDALAPGWLGRLAATVDDPSVRAALLRADRLAGAPAQQALADIGLGPLAASTVAAALWCVAAFPGDPVTAIATAASVPGDADTIAALAGALAGAAWGASRLPSHWTAPVERAGDLRHLADRVVDHLAPVAATATSSGAEVWFLLDRSGSMQTIAADVVGGFNQFFAEQRAHAGVLRVTVVQFDDQDPHEVLVDRADVATVGDLDAHRYQPRGMTPLYDAMALLLDRAERAGGAPTDQLVVVFTDGLENASRCVSRADVFARIGRLKEAGWTFVFLGANQDSYAAGGGLGVDAGSVSNFRADRQGVQAAFGGISRGTREWRDKSPQRRHAERDDFWGGHKEAEEPGATPADPA